VANSYFDIPEPIRIKAIEAGAPKPQLSIALQAAPEKAALGYPGKSAGDVLFNGAAGTLLVSLGEAPKMITDTFRVAGGSVGRWLVQNAAPSAEISVNNVNGFGIPNALAAFCEGLLLGVFKFERHKKASNSIEPFTVSVRAQNGLDGVETVVRRATILARAVNLARDWGHEPANVINPVTLAERAVALSERYGLKCTILDEKKLEEIGAGAILSVGKGSHQTPPRIIVLEYAGKNAAADAQPVVLVGKGLTFDSGGYSMKDTANMQGMKYDKCGAMAVLAAIAAAAELGVSTPIVAIIGAAENMVSSYAYRPDDLITSLAGKTIEIISTDAEGRLVLADCLTYAQRKYSARAVIDLATLTGGVVVALGRLRAGILSNNTALSEQLAAAGERTHERLWPLPLDEEYFQLLKSDDGDMKNSATVREAHPIVGGIFLRQFVEDTVPWAHLDIAGLADTPKDSAYCPRGATGFGVRLLIDYLESL